MSNFLYFDISMYSQTFSVSTLGLQYDHIRECKCAFTISFKCLIQSFLAKKLK